MKIKLVLIFFLAANLVWAQQQNSSAWKADLRVYQQELEKRHIDLYNKISKQQFNNELDEIAVRLEKLSDWQIAANLMQLTRKVGDGHTAVSVANWECSYYPIQLRKISGGWRVIKTARAYSELLGTTLKKIEGIAISEIEKKLAKTAQYVENKYSEPIRIGEYMVLSELLQALEITESTEKVKFLFETDKGETLERIVRSVASAELKREPHCALELKTPGLVKPKMPDFEYLWFTQLSDIKATYIRFDRYPAFDEAVSFAEKLVGFMKQNHSQRLIIDMRNNGGGDLYVGLVLANALNLVDEIDWKTGVYVLSSGFTFSAGTSNVALFRELLNAKIVGMPTGSNPTGYQDMDAFELPNSKLRITYSKRLFRIQETPSEGVQPDMLIDYKWGDYVKGVDTILEEVIRQLSTH